MKSGFTITIENITGRDLTWSEYQSAMSTARTLDAVHDWKNPLVVTSTVKTVVRALIERPDTIIAKVSNLEDTGLP